MFLGHEISYSSEQIVKNREKFPILILGAGALGSWLLDLLARQGYANLSILDFDKVEAKNFGTQNYGKNDVGRQKVVAACNNLYIRLGIKSNPIAEKLTEKNAKNLLSKYKLAIDAFDNYESRQIVKNICSDLKINCIHCGLSSDGFCEVTWNKYYSISKVKKNKETTEPCEYPLSTNLVHIAVGCVAQVINKYVDHEFQENINFTIKDMHIQILK